MGEHLFFLKFSFGCESGVSQNRRRLLDFDGRWGKLGLGKKIKDDPMGRGGVPPLSLVGAILSIF